MANGARKRRLVWAALAVTAALLAASPLIGARLRGRSVAAVPLERTEIVQTVVATGRVAALARVEIGSIVAGTVAEVTVREGDRVRHIFERFYQGRTKVKQTAGSGLGLALVKNVV